MKKILFRADAAPSIGTGDLMSFNHFWRQLQISSSDWKAHFMIKDHPAARDLLQGQGIQDAVVIPSNLSPVDETHRIQSFVLTNQVDVVFFQLTASKLTDYDLANINAIKCAVDFYNWIPRRLDLVVNWDTTSNEVYRNSEFQKTLFFLGPGYVFLPVEFGLLEKAKRSYHWPPKNILIAMGGADEFNMTAKVLKDLIPNVPSLTHFTVIVGAGFDRLASLRQISKASNVKITVKKNIKNMLAEYLSADYAFGAGGLTAYELVASHTPCSLIACYGHQINRCKYFAKKKWARYLGFKDELGPIRIPEQIQILKNRFTSRIGEVIAALEDLTLHRQEKCFKSNRNPNKSYVEKEFNYCRPSG